jgi:hypothetical protein
LFDTSPSNRITEGSSDAHYAFQFLRNGGNKSSGLSFFSTNRAFRTVVHCAEILKDFDSQRSLLRLELSLKACSEPHIGVGVAILCASKSRLGLATRKRVRLWCLNDVKDRRLDKIFSASTVSFLVEAYVPCKGRQKFAKV